MDVPERGAAIGNACIRAAQRRSPVLPAPLEHRLEIRRADSSRSQCLAIAIFTPVRLATEQTSRLFDRMTKFKLFESVKRVVMHEGRDGPLCGQHVSRVLNRQFEMTDCVLVTLAPASPICESVREPCSEEGIVCMSSTRMQ